MRNLGVIRRFSTANFVVIVDAIEELDLDLSFDDTGEVAEKLDSGEYVAFCARARVLFKGQEIASDYLGECIYRSFEEFMDHKECAAQNRQHKAGGRKARCGSYFSSMIANVCAEARTHLLELKRVRVREAA